MRMAWPSPVSSPRVPNQQAGAPGGPGERGHGEGGRGRAGKLQRDDLMIDDIVVAGVGAHRPYGPSRSASSRAAAVKSSITALSGQRCSPRSSRPRYSRGAEYGQSASTGQATHRSAEHGRAVSGGEVRQAAEAGDPQRRPAQDEASQSRSWQDLASSMEDRRPRGASCRGRGVAWCQKPTGSRCCTLMISPSCPEPMSLSDGARVRRVTHNVADGQHHPGLVHGRHDLAAPRLVRRHGLFQQHVVAPPRRTPRPERRACDPAWR